MNRPRNRAERITIMKNKNFQKSFLRANKIVRWNNDYILFLEIDKRSGRTCSKREI